MDLSETLARRAPEEILDIVLTAFDKMSEDQKLRIKDLLDSSGFSDQIVEALGGFEEEDENDEPNEPANPPGSDDPEIAG